MFTHLVGEFRYALRSLRTRPLFAFIAVATLALGIGANTAVFSVLYGLFLAPLPYPQGEQLVDVHNSYPKTPGLEYAGTSIPDYLDRKSQVQSLEDLALYAWSSFNLAPDGGAPEHVQVIKATPSLFTTLRVAPALGRAFDDSHAVVGSDNVVVLSDTLWRNRFGAAANIIGRDVRLSGQPYRVLGVMPPGFSFPDRNIQAWVPFAFTPEQRRDDQRGNEYSASVGRLRSGVSIATLNAELDAVIARNAERLEASSDERARGFAAFLRAGNFTGRALNLREQQVGEIRAMVMLLQVAVVMVLLIATANIANLLLTRMLARQRELAVRSALGASRARIARQVLIEVLVLAIIGAGLGVALAFLLIDAMPLVGIEVDSGGYTIGVDAPVLAFALIVTVLSALLAGLVPTLSAARISPAPVMNAGGRGGSQGHLAAASRTTLVVAQVALATTLLIGAGLLLRSFSALQSQSPGFASAGRISARVALPQNRYADQPARERFYTQALEQLSQIPGVASVAYSSLLPLSGGVSTGSYRIVGREVADGQAAPHAHQRFVSDDYFQTMGIPLLTGRGFTSADRADSTPVVVIDQRMVEKYFKDQDPIGQQLTRGGDSPAATVVGVVGSVRQENLRDPIEKETLYWSYRQRTPGDGAFVVRSAGVAPAALLPNIREAILAVDSEQPVYDVKLLDARIAQTMSAQRAPMLLIGVFAAVAMALSALGVYGVLAYAVRQRQSEFGIRMAIGEPPSGVLKRIVGQGVRLGIVGLGIGAVGALAGARFVQSQLFGISARDPMTYAAVVGFLLLVTVLACLLPALRASRTDPMVALRNE